MLAKQFCIFNNRIYGEDLAPVNAFKSAGGSMRA